MQTISQTNNQSITVTNQPIVEGISLSNKQLVQYSDKSISHCNNQTANQISNQSVKHIVCQVIKEAMKQTINQTNRQINQSL